MIKQMTKMIKNDENDNTHDKTYNKNDTMIAKDM